MDKLNQFFRKLYTNPALMWKAMASLLFIGMGVVFLFLYGTSDSSRFALSIVLLIYGLFRLGTFYLDLTRRKNE